MILGFHILDVDDLRGDKARSTASGEKVHFSVREFGESKICNNAIESIFFSEKNVLRFKISVHDFFGVHVFESFKQSFDDMLNFFGFELVFFLNKKRVTLIF